MSKTIYLKFAKISIFEKFVIVVMNEGINVIPEYNDDLAEIAKEYFNNQFFGYISLRLNSYSVDPLVYLETSKIENLMAFAVVSSPNEILEGNVKLERQFFKKPFEHFTSLDHAKKWILNIIENKTYESSES